MKGVSYRRSNLREALLDRATAVVCDRGAGALSLRELARDVGVSHAAPARHFADRDQLLAAVAVEGFTALAAQLADALSSSDDIQEQARNAGRAYAAFAIQKAKLMAVMFAHDEPRASAAIGQSATEAFAPLLVLFRRGEQAGVVAAGGAETAATLFVATLQGLTSLANCGVVPADAVPALVDDAVTRFFDTARPDLRESRS